MLVSTLALCVFGSFGIGANGQANLYNNTLYLSTGVVCAGTLKNTSSYASFDYEYKVVADCDFRERTDDNGNTEYWVHFNSWTGTLWYYPDDGSDASITVQSTSYYNAFESALITDPLNHLDMSCYIGGQTTTNGTIYGFCDFYDHGLDENSGITCSKQIPLLNSTLVATRPTALQFRVDLDDLTRQVKNGFDTARGGYNTGYDTGYAVGKEEGTNQGYTTGYSDGYSAGVEVNGTAFTIFNGILNIGMIPVNFFLAMFNFNILGINISNFILSLISVLITIYIYRLATAKKE